MTTISSGSHVPHDIGPVESGVAGASSSLPDVLPDFSVISIASHQLSISGDAIGRLSSADDSVGDHHSVHPHPSGSVVDRTTTAVRGSLSGSSEDPHAVDPDLVDLSSVEDMFDEPVEGEIGGITIGASLAPTGPDPDSTSTLVDPNYRDPDDLDDPFIDDPVGDSVMGHVTARDPTSRPATMRSAPASPLPTPDPDPTPPVSAAPISAPLAAAGPVVPPPPAAPAPASPIVHAPPPPPTPGPIIATPAAPISAPLAAAGPVVPPPPAAPAPASPIAHAPPPPPSTPPPFSDPAAFQVTGFQAGVNRADKPQQQLVKILDNVKKFANDDDKNVKWTDIKISGGLDPTSVTPIKLSDGSTAYKVKCKYTVEVPVHDPEPAPDGTDIPLKMEFEEELYAKCPSLKELPAIIKAYAETTGKLALLGRPGQPPLDGVDAGNKAKFMAMGGFSFNFNRNAAGQIIGLKEAKPVNRSDVPEKDRLTNSIILNSAAKGASAPSRRAGVKAGVVHFGADEYAAAGHMKISLPKKDLKDVLSAVGSDPNEQVAAMKEHVKYHEEHVANLKAEAERLKAEYQVKRMFRDPTESDAFVALKADSEGYVLAKKIKENKAQLAILQREGREIGEKLETIKEQIRRVAGEAAGAPIPVDYFDSDLKALIWPGGRQPDPLTKEAAELHLKELERGLLKDTATNLTAIEKLGKENESMQNQLAVASSRPSQSSVGAAYKNAKAEYKAAKAAHDAAVRDSAIVNDQMGRLKDLLDNNASILGDPPPAPAIDRKGMQIKDFPPGLISRVSDYLTPDAIEKFRQINEDSGSTMTFEEFINNEAKGLEARLPKATEEKLNEAQKNYKAATSQLLGAQQKMVNDFARLRDIQQELDDEVSYFRRLDQQLDADSNFKPGRIMNRDPAGVKGLISQIEEQRKANQSLLQRYEPQIRALFS